MSDAIGRIIVPTAINSGQTFPLTTQYRFGFSVERPVIVHRFGSLDAKPQYYAGIGPRKFRFKRPNLNWTESNQIKVVTSCVPTTANSKISAGRVAQNGRRVCVRKKTHQGSQATLENRYHFCAQRLIVDFNLIQNSSEGQESGCFHTELHRHSSLAEGSG
jgi:hypothetical protein